MKLGAGRRMRGVDKALYFGRQRLTL